MIVQCTSCRTRFNAPDEFAGRKVRCRKCHAILMVPYSTAGGRDVLHGDSLEHLDEQGYSSSGRGGLELVDPDELFQRVSSEFEAPRSNALYAYPMSHQVDRWLPAVLALLPFAWVCSQVFTTASAAALPAWVAVLRLTVILAAFFLLVLPSAYYAVRVAARKCNFQLPYLVLWRVGAVFSMPYMFGVAMWLIAGNGSDFVIGCLLGLVMALPALWLLLRLDAQEGPVTLSLAGGAFVGSTIVAAGIVMLFALAANASSDPANKPTAMAQNPLGPGLRWDRPPDQPKATVIAKADPVAAVEPDPLPPQPTPATREAVVSVGPTRTPPITPSVTPRPAPFSPNDPFAAATTQATPVATPVPQPVVIPPKPVMPDLATTRPGEVDPLATGELPPPSPLVSSLRVGFVGRYESVLAAPAPRSHVAVLRRAAGGQWIVTRWDVNTWRPAGEATFLGRESDFHLSSDGALVGRIVSFPSLSLQVYSFLERRFRDPVKLDNSQGEPTVLGFAGPSKALIHWRRSEDGSSGLEVVDAMAAKWTKRIPKIGNFDLVPGKFAISDDGRLAAVLTHDQAPDERPTASIELYSLETTERLAKTIPVTEIAWTGAVRVSGLAVSPGRTEVTLLLENEGRGLILTWDVETGKLKRQYLEQGGLVPVGIDTSLFAGNALNYLDGGNAWLVYGCSIYDVGNGQRLGALNLQTPLRQWVAGSTCYVYRTGDQGLGLMNAARVDTDKLRSMLAKRRE